MSVYNVVSIWLCLLTTCEFTTGLQRNAINVITTYTYTQSRYTTECGFLWLGRCTRYRWRSRSTSRCKAGYRSEDNIGCPYKCTAISNCQAEQCTSNRDQVCTRCDGVVSHETGQRAYLLNTNKKACTKTCSWRNDSTRCYPGTCRGENASNCACSSGFTGQHCQTITTKPTIKLNLFRLTASNGDTAQAPPNINSGPSQSRSWSNIKSPTKMYYKFTAEYKMTAPSRHAFIEGFSAGIVSAYASFKLKRRWRVVSSKGYNCGGASRGSPDTDLYTCEGAPVLPLPFQNKDIIEFSYKASNGGYVKVRNKETKNLVTHYYSGATQTHTFTMNIDLVAPYHCTGTTACISSMLTAPNAITTPTVNLRWSGWSDVTAGVDHFVRDVYELHAVGDVLRDKRRIDRKTLTSSVGKSVYTTDKFRLSTSGVYSVVLSAYDKAGNHRSARRILIYDGTSSVTTQANKKLRVTTATSATSEWQTTSSAVTVDWTNRYINTVHHNKKWLHSVAPLADIGSGYDDKEGSRGLDEVRNVQGITSFRTSYKVDHKGGSSMTSPPAVFTTQGLSQSQTITPSFVDGDTVRFWVRAYDIMSDTKEESVTVHIDTSPPVIENLWLTRNGSLNITVHDVKELNDVIMEWNLYDRHSGVEEVEWRIVEKRQDEDIVLAVHGISIKSYRTMGACNTIYGTRDGSCYCTPHDRCYHPHFKVKPSPADIKKVKLADGKEYCFEVKATNHAKLKTEQEVKITMDASPPRSGIVHDGQSGQPEVDYQDSLQLHAHWDGFFDKESAISFYQYTFGPRCLQGDLFDLNQTKNMESTRSTEVSWTAPSCGTFYVTVVAYNGAQRRSDAVCSDGVETCIPTPVPSEPSKSEGNPLVGKTLVLILSGTGSAVVAVAAVIVGVVVWKRKQRRQPESPDQAVYYNTGLSKKGEPKKTKPRTNKSQPEARTYDTLDVNSRDTGPGEEAYCSIQTPGTDENSMYEPIDSQMYLNSCLPPRVTSDTSNDLYEEI